MHDASQVFHIIAGLPRAGAETLLSRIVKEGAQRGDQHLVVNLGSPTALSKEMTEYAEVVNLDLKRNPLKAIWAFVNLWRAKRKSVTLVSGWMYYGGIISALLKFSAHGRVMAHIRHTPVSLSNESHKIKIALRLLRLLTPKLDAVTYNSMHAQTWHEAFGFKARRHFVVDNGYTVDGKRPLTLRDPTRTSFVIGAAARNHPMKNLAGLINAFEKLIASDEHYELHIAGKDTDKLANLPAFSRAKDKIKLFGEVDAQAICDFYTELDAYVSFSSWGESFQNVVAEAMSFGVPALCTDIGAAKKIVVRESFVVPIEDEARLIQRLADLKRMAATPEDWHALKLRCRDKIAENFSISQAYDQIICERN
ncbi:glycosyltransferase [Shimia sp. R9_3]|uniref:glycosyltransferase n=1 Tax=Shimia sp. R9_3 TaxID=2821113 RepID=UPI001ADD1B13|nr:glycosyltransferase [Shimia sp. R9_3]MBO9399398.1 glycosyltransferase [Shimia sp. R9_3]